MIVLDASTLVSAAFNRQGVPALAVRRAFAVDQVAVSPGTMAELLGVLVRPRIVRFTRPQLRDELLVLLDGLGVPFARSESVADCRDPKDN